MRRWWVLLCLLLVAASAREVRLLRVANSAFRDQLYDFAERQYSTFLEEFPESDRVPAVRRLLAQCQLGQGKWEAALQTLRAGKEAVAADDIPSRFWVAEALAFGGEFAAAEQHYVAVLDHGESSRLTGPASCGLAYVRCKQGRYREAAEILAVLDERQLPDELKFQAALLRSQVLMAQGSFAVAEGILQEFLEGNPESYWGYRAVRWQAELAARQGDWAGASDKYQQVIQSYQQQPNKWVDAQLAAEAWMGLGWIAWQQEKFDEAIDPFSQALALAAQPWLRRDAMVKLGESYVRTGKLAQGIARLKDFLGDHRQDPLAEEVQLAIADLFDADGDFGAALAEYKELPARYPRSELAARASFQAGWCASRLQRFPDALTLFQQAFALASHSEHPAASAELAAQALFKVADVQVEVGALADAVGSYQRLVSSYPNSDLIDRALFQLGHVYQQTGDDEAAIAVLGDLVDQFPQSALAPEAMFQIAQIQVDNGDESSARKTFEQAAELFRDTPWRDRARLAIGESFYREEKYEDAIAAFTGLIEDTPGSKLGQQAAKNRGWCYEAQGDSEKTLAEFSAFLEAYPDSSLAPSLEFWIGDHYTRQKDHLKAQEHYQAIHQKYPGTPMADAGLYFAARAAYLRQDYRNVIELDETLLKEYPNSSFRCAAQFSWADAHTELNEFEEALGMFDALVEEFPDCEMVCEAHGRRGDCYYTLKRYDKAIAAFREAQVCAREAPPALKNQIQYKLGQSYEKAERLDEALECFTRVLYESAADPDPDLPPERFWLRKAGLAAGSIHERQQQWREAITIYTRLADLCPDLREMLDEKLRQIRVDHFILF